MYLIIWSLSQIIRAVESDGERKTNNIWRKKQKSVKKNTFREKFEKKLLTLFFFVELLIAVEHEAIRIL